MRLRIRLAAVLVAVSMAALVRGAAAAGGDEVDPARIRVLLETRNFAELGALLEGYQAACDRDIRFEYAAYECFRAFAVRSQSYGALLDDWVRSAPGNWAALTARASHLAAAGGRERGARRANDQAAEQPRRPEDGVAPAVRDLEASLRIRPRQFYAYALLMQIGRNAGDRQNGGLLARRALAFYPDSYLLRRSHMISLSPRLGGSYEAMENFARQSAPYAARNPRLRILPGLIPWDMGRAAAADGDYDAAVALYGEALSYGTTWDFLYDLAHCRYLAKQYDAALMTLDRAMALNPGSAEGHGLRSKIHFAQRNLDAATASLEDMERSAGLAAGEASDIRVWESGRLVADGHALFRSRDLAAAIDRYTDAIRIYANNADAYCWRGIAHDRTGNSAAALADLKQAIALNPRLFAAYKGLEDVLARQGRLAESVEWWTRLIRLEPSNDNAYVERSGAYMRTRDKDAAVRDLDRACGMGNDQACFLLLSLPGAPRR